MLYLDGIVRTADHSVALGKLCASCFVIRGAQLSVVRRLDSAHVVNVHTGALNFVCKRIAAYASANNKRARNRALVFFKVLSPMLTALEARDALKMCVVSFLADLRGWPMLMVVSFFCFLVAKRTSTRRRRRRRSRP